MKRINTICSALEGRLTEAGDLISFECREAVKLAETATGLSSDQISRLESCIRKLNRNAPTTAAYLGAAGVREIYNSISEQMNAVAAKAGLKDELVPLDDEIAKGASAAGCFRNLEF